MPPTSLPLSIREFLFPPLLLTCQTAIVVRKWLDISSVWRIELCFVGSATLQYTQPMLLCLHQRFLLTGVRVGLEPTELGASCSSMELHSGEEMKPTYSSSVAGSVTSVPSSCEHNETLHDHVGGVGDFVPPNVSYTGGSAAGSISHWPLDELFRLTEFSQGYNYMDNRSSKADSGKFGEFDSPTSRSAEEELDDDECLGQAPDSSWTVPQLSFPPTASELHWPKNIQYSPENSVFVPDICSSPMEKSHHLKENANILRRQRQL